jgi:starch synthase (maltosyl-transferring)
MPASHQASHDVPLIYNLFPRLAGPCNRWRSHAERAAGMGFNWLFVNPIHMPGFSGSLYAVKEYDLLNPAFLPEGTRDQHLEVLRPALQEIIQCGMAPMVDLVLNHTAIDSSLVAQHPNWYMRDAEGNVQNPYAVDPDDPGKKTIWGDLAEIDNRHSPDREHLWEFWGQLVERYLDLGFQGFRCDAAYKVPAELWRFLIDRALRKSPQAVFWAENLGCTVEETRALGEAGFHFFCNSSKWWNFKDAWCLIQHREFQDMPSVAFPETHDTPRLAAESGGNEAVQRQRYVFAALFSSGIMMPVGYEFGFQQPLHVVTTTPDQWESPRWDLQNFIRAVNDWKMNNPLWHGEGELVQRAMQHSDLCVLERRSLKNPDLWAVMCVNVNIHEPVEVSIADVGPLPSSPRMRRASWLDHHADPLPIPERLSLQPAEVIVIATF